MNAQRNSPSLFLIFTLFFSAISISAEAQKPITVIATIRAKSGREDEVAKLLQTIVEPSRKEAGNLRYDLNQLQSDRGFFLFEERWISMEAFHNHGETPHLKAIFKILFPNPAKPNESDLVTGPPTDDIYDPL